MAQWNSSLLHTSPSSPHTDGKFKDLLPPRKRLLACLKHIDTDSAAIAGSSPASFPAQACHVDEEAHAEPPSCSLLLRSPSHKCLSCGDGSEVLHRVPCLGGATSYVCSSCVLLSNKKMYCIECLEIIERGAHALSPWLSPLFFTCCRCQRLTHLDCALKMWSPFLKGSGLTLCRECYARNNGQYREVPTKTQKTAAGFRRSKQGIGSGWRVKFPEIDQQCLVAAKIVAYAAKKDASEAKERAKMLAKAAARAAAQAKAALDDVYMLSQKKAGKKKEGHDAGVEDMESKVGERARTSRGLKKRALSAIVASEAQSMGNRIAAAPASKLKEKLSLLRTSSDADDGHSTQARPGIKRRKTLSSLTNTHLSIKKSVGPSV